MPDKPKLLLLRGQDAEDPDKLAEFFYQLTGRRPMPEEIEEARKLFAENINGDAQP